ncbi:MAG TPA: DUF2330 domain-containing protein, partial [Kofleriaceae bacterium]
KVDPTKVKFVDGRAELSPLRFHYDTDQFNLPIRLGLANSSGKQDLIVNILAPDQRYEVANYKNVTIPTNIDVKDSVKDKFGAFYTALFDATIEKNPGAVVTEYAWQATTCDPCPGPALNQNDFVLLGSDVLEAGAKPGKNDPTTTKAPGRPIMRPPPGGMPGFVLTRLHARYGKDITDDLQFKAAEPIVGGREFVVDPKTHKLEEGAQKSTVNNFQGRYAIRHPWTGAIACQSPIRNRWGGPPGRGEPPPPVPGLELAFAPRGEVKLPEAVKQNIPELGIVAAAATITAPVPPAPTTVPAPATEKKKTGCGCGTTDNSGGFALALALLLVVRRRRA